MICAVSNIVIGLYSYAEPIAIAGEFLRDVQISVGRIVFIFYDIFKASVIIMCTLASRRCFLLLDDRSCFFWRMVLFNKTIFFPFIAAEVWFLDVAGDFFRDLQEEFQNWEANASSQGKPKSLWEELGVSLHVFHFSLRFWRLHFSSLKS